MAGSRRGGAGVEEPAVVGAAEAGPAAEPAARVEQGDLVGLLEDGVACFRGIPYAAPPVGALRWRPPRSPSAWTGRRDARAFGAVCPQPEPPEGAEVDARLASLPQSEDCLTLNVWTTAAAGEKHPVMVWIHGGAGRIGYAAKPVYDGTSFAKRGVVLVSFNYRLGHLGVFAAPALTAETGDEPSGNYGLMDQIAALEWVKRNIGAFGGDPENVTVFGQSAGGESVLFLLTSPRAGGLFAKAIVQSGGGGGGWRSTRTRAEQEAADAAYLSAAIGGSPSAAALRDLPVRSLMPDRLSLFSPFIDGTVVGEAPAATLRAGRARAVPLLVGNNDDEALSLIGRFGVSPERVLEAIGPAGRALYADEGADMETRARRVLTDMQFTMPARFVARAMARAALVWLYHFRYVPEAHRRAGAGVAHEADIPFIFDTLSCTGWTDLTEADLAKARQVNACWASFARTGLPAPGSVDWPQFEAAAETLLVIDTQDAARTGYRKAQLDFAVSASRSGVTAAAGM